LEKSGTRGRTIVAFALAQGPELQEH